MYYFKEEDVLRPGYVRLEIIETIGKGGFATIYNAKGSNGKEFAVKVMTIPYNDYLWGPFRDESMFCTEASKCADNV